MNARRTALVTGVTGQLGHYVAERLLRESYRVFGLVRDPAGPASGGSSTPLDQPPSGSSTPRLLPLGGSSFVPWFGDLGNPAALERAVRETHPDEVYHFAAMTFVPDAWSDPARCAELNAVAVIHLLEAVRRHAPEARVLQAGSSEMFGDAATSPQDEQTHHLPRNPYGASKSFAHRLVQQYRERHGVHGCNAIVFPNESPRRRAEFVFRKITRGVAAIAAAGGGELTLGNLDAKRDWSWSGDIADGAIRILHHESPDDYVLASGEAHSVRELVELSFGLVGLRAEDHVRVDPALVRPVETVTMVGDCTKAAERLGWRPRIGFVELVKRVLAADLEAAGATVPFQIADTQPT